MDFIYSSYKFMKVIGPNGSEWFFAGTLIVQPSHVYCEVYYAERPTTRGSRRKRSTKKVMGICITIHELDGRWLMVDAHCSCTEYNTYVQLHLELFKNIS